MLEEMLIVEALLNLRYQRLKRHVFKALWSSPDVEHYIYFNLFGTPKQFLSADFGFRSPKSELFSIKTFRVLGGSRLSAFKHDMRTGCSMSFSFGRLCGDKRWYLDVSLLPGSIIAERITEKVRGVLLPRIRNQTTTRSLLATLLSDVEPYPWVATNGAIRAAQIVALAGNLSIGADDIRSLLTPYHKWIRVGGFAQPASFVDQVIDQWRQDHTG